MSSSESGERRVFINAVMDPVQMADEELEYELKLRNMFDPTDCREVAVERLKDNLGASLVQSRVDALLPMGELCVLNTKIGELRTIIEEANLMWDEVHGSAQFARLSTLYVHCIFRLRRIMFKNPMVYKDFLKLNRRFIKIQRQLEEMYPDYAFPYVALRPDTSSEDSGEERARKEAKKQEKKERKRQEREQREREEKEKAERERLQQEELEREIRRREKEKEKKDKHSKKKTKEKKIKKENKKKKHTKSRYRSPSPHYRSDASTSDSSSSSGSSGGGSSSGPSAASSRIRHKEPRVGRHNPVTKWAMRFGKGDDLHKFLLEVEEAADVHRATDEELLLGLSTLLTGQAQIWYRRNKLKIRTWTDFKKQIKDAFTPDDDDEDVLAKLDGLKQKSDETFAVYEAQFEELFERLANPLAERQKLKKLMNGLHLYYRSKLRILEIDSVRMLRQQCKILEADKTQIRQKEKEEKRKDRKKEDKDGRRENRKEGRKSAKAAAVAVDTSASDASSDAEVHAAAAAPGKRVSGLSPVVPCWRCGRTGHIPFDCDFTIFCRKCGAQDTVAESCPKCTRAQAQGKWQRQQGNASGDSTGRTLAPWTSIPPPNVLQNQAHQQPGGSGTQNPGGKHASGGKN